VTEQKPNAPQEPLKPAHKRSGSILRTAKAVLWSFVGLRSRRDYEQDIEQLNPVHIVVIGLLGAGVFVGSLILVATLVVAK
jgi:Protein of unknown function (DUF2970)